MYGSNNDKESCIYEKILLLIYMMFPVLVMAQGHKGEVDECAPMKTGRYAIAMM